MPVVERDEALVRASAAKRALTRVEAESRSVQTRGGRSSLQADLLEGEVRATFAASSEQEAPAGAMGASAGGGVVAAGLEELVPDPTSAAGASDVRRASATAVGLLADSRRPRDSQQEAAAVEHCGRRSGASARAWPA